MCASIAVAGSELCRPLTQKADVAELEALVLKQLERTHEGGPQFVHAVRDILRSEQRWLAWKVRPDPSLPNAQKPIDQYHYHGCIQPLPTGASCFQQSVRSMEPLIYMTQV